MKIKIVLSALCVIIFLSVYLTSNNVKSDNYVYTEEIREGVFPSFEDCRYTMSITKSLLRTSIGNVSDFIEIMDSELDKVYMWEIRHSNYTSTLIGCSDSHGRIWNEYYPKNT